MADRSEKNTRRSSVAQWVFGVLILVLSVVNVRVAADKFENRARHNRISTLYETKHRLFSRYQPTELSILEYQTVDEPKTKGPSRFKKLDRLLNILHKPKMQHVLKEMSTIRPEMSSFPIYFGIPTEGVLDANQMLGDDDFQFNELNSETTTSSVKSTESLEWDNNIADKPQPSVLEPSTPNTPSPTTTISTTTINQNQLQDRSTPLEPPLHHRHRSHHQQLTETVSKLQLTEMPLNKNNHFTPHHYKFPTELVVVKQPTKTERNNIEAVIDDNIDEVEMETTCKTPRPKVVHVKDVYPHSFKTYYPHCIILHQCGSDTGCCDDERKVCRPKASAIQRVYLKIYVFLNFTQRTEKLEFFNHTECECMDKFSDTALGSQQQQDQPTRLPPAPAARLCACPHKFSVRRTPDGKCMCDCFHLQKDCLRLKRGKDYFSKEDQLCIKNSTCLHPSCEFGHYLPKYARCVKKVEMFTHWPKYSVQDTDS